MRNNQQQGSAVVYIVLMMFLMMTSSAIILSGVLNKHIRSAQDYLSSERAFATANTGVEQKLYDLVKSNNTDEKKGDINYGTDKASYDAKGKLVPYNGSNSPCVTSSGTYRDLVRRIALGEGVPGCDL
jgi:Tfp pilus assembly protein PilX